MEKVFLQFLNMSITASYVILLIIIVRLLLRRVPKIFSYALWSIAFVRLVCPFSVESCFSLIRFDTKAIPNAVVHGNVPRIDGGISAIDIYAGHAMPAEAVQASAHSIHMWIVVGAYVWLFGIFVLIAYSILASAGLYKKLKPSDLIQKNIYENENIRTPFVFGILRPKIYLPSNLSDKERVYIIKHEQTHIRRYDHVMKPLSFLVLCVHWYNPLVWAAFLLMGEDMELSCDESVIKQLGGDIKKDYASSILSLSARKRKKCGCLLAFSENSTKGRIMNILNYKKPAFWMVFSSILIVSAIGLALLTNPQAERMTERDYAEQFVQTQIAAYKDAKWADFTNIDYEIIKFDKLDRFEDILDSPVEIWHIEYRWRADDIEKASLGNVNYIDGWIFEDNSMGFKALVFSYDTSAPEFLGSIFSIDGLNGNGETVAGRETLLRVYLEQQGLLPRETYSGDHVIVEFPLSTGETCRLLLSQPSTQGDLGIWCIERWMDGNGSVYYDIPATEGRIGEYYDSLQITCDEGHKPYLIDPVHVALEYINGSEGLGQRTGFDKLKIQYHATAADFLETPTSHYIGYISNFTIDEYAKPYFHLDRIEWLTLEDEKRLKELNINPDDLPNGFYIYNPVSYPMFHQVSNEAEYSIIVSGTNGVIHRIVTLNEFIQHLDNFGEFAPPFHIITKDGYVQSITEQYVP